MFPSISEWIVNHLSNMKIRKELKNMKVKFCVSANERRKTSVIMSEHSESNDLLKFGFKIALCSLSVN